MFENLKKFGYTSNITEPSYLVFFEDTVNLTLRYLWVNTMC